MADDTDTGTGDEATSEAGTEGELTEDKLGAGGVAALKQERSARAAYERENKALKARLEELETASLDEVGKAVKTAADNARAEALAEVRSERVKDKVEVAAASKLQDPDLAPALLGDLTRFVSDDGQVDTKAISAAIDELVTARPYLAPVGDSRPSPLPGGGAKPARSSTNPIDDALRARR